MKNYRKPMIILTIYLISFFLPSVACKWLTDPTDKEILREKMINQEIMETQSALPHDDDKIIVKNTDYTGNIAIITDSPCETSAIATLTAYDDNTCKLSLSYKQIYSLSDGTCSPTDFKIAWNIFGNLDDSEATCNIQYCNKPSYYSASGKVRFNSTMAWGDQTITCTSKSNGSTDITIKGFVLNVSAP